MWSCDPPRATRIVLAVLVGLVASAFAAPPLALGAAAAGRTLPMRTAALVAATVALLVGTARVEQFDRRVLRAGGFAGTVTVTGQPSADRALASAAGAGETVVLVAPGVALQQGAVYRVSGRLRPLDPVVRGYYATQGAHLELRAARCAMTGRRGGLWGVVDDVHRAALSGMGVGPRSPPPRALVAGVMLGDSGALPTDVRAQLRTSGLYHLVAVSGENVALVTVLVLIALGLAGVVGTPARVAAMIGTGCYVLF
jgi:competence protein ComEC